MKLTRQSVLNALCPVCALGGEVIPLHMTMNSLEIYCINGHRFPTIELSMLAERVGKRDRQIKN